nr:hypothetical protein [Escherichia coli O25b:H4-ST131]
MRGLRARQEVRIRCGEYRMLNVPSVSCSQAPIIRFADSWPRQKRAVRSTLPSTLSGVLQPFRLCRRTAAEIRYPAGTFRSADGIYGAPVICATAV